MSFILLGILNSQAASGGPPAPDFLTSAPLWLDAADDTTISESSGSVSQWDNKGTLANFSQASSSLQPTTGVSTINGLNIIDFSSSILVSDDTASVWSFLNSQGTYFVAGVFRLGSQIGSLATIALTSDLSSRIGFPFVTSSTNRFLLQIRENTSLSVDVVDDGFMPEGDNIYSFLVDADASPAADRFSYFRNNLEGTVENAATSLLSGLTPEHTMNLGGRAATSSNFANISFAEFIIVSGADATESNRQQTVDYLNAKWGIF